MAGFLAPLEMLRAVIAFLTLKDPMMATIADEAATAAECARNTHEAAAPHPSPIVRKLRYGLKARWFHPQTKCYVQAIMDAVIWLTIFAMAYGAALSIHASKGPFDHRGASMIKLGKNVTAFWILESDWLVMAFASATGMSVGSFLSVLGEWKLVIAERDGNTEEGLTPASRERGRKFVVLGRLRMPRWVYVAVAVPVALAAPIPASAAAKEVYGCFHHSFGFDASARWMLQADLGYFVVVFLFCFIDAALVVARVVIENRYMPRLEPVPAPTPDEKWQAENGSHTESRA